MSSTVVWPSIGGVRMASHFLGIETPSGYGGDHSRRARPADRRPGRPGTGQPRRAAGIGLRRRCHPRSPATSKRCAAITCRHPPTVAVVPGLPPFGRWRGPPAETSHIRGSPPSPRSQPPRRRAPSRRPTAPDARARRPPPNPVLPYPTAARTAARESLSFIYPPEPPGVDGRVQPAVLSCPARRIDSRAGNLRRQVVVMLPTQLA